jgi:hypothetical protein
VIGDNIGFAIGRSGGRRLVRYGRHILLTPERLDKAIGFFERHGGKVVAIARFVEGLGQARAIIAGATGMRPACFWRSTPSEPRSGSRSGAASATSQAAASMRSTTTASDTSTSRSPSARCSSPSSPRRLWKLRAERATDLA